MRRWRKYGFRKVVWPGSTGLVRLACKLMSSVQLWDANDVAGRCSSSERAEKHPYEARLPIAFVPIYNSLYPVAILGYLAGRPLALVLHVYIALSLSPSLSKVT